MIKFVIFDLDGVLVDTVDLHYKSLNEALGDFAISESERDEYEGMRTVDKLNLLTKNKNLPLNLHKQIIDEKHRIYVEYISNLKPNHDIIKLLQKLKRFSVKLAVCSNSNRECLDICLDRINAKYFFDITLSSNDVGKHKPDPEIYLKALELSRYEAYETIVIEDSYQGVQAAIAANCKVLCVKNTSDVNINLLQKILLK